MLSGYTLLTNSSFDLAGNKRDFYRGKGLYGNFLQGFNPNKAGLFEGSFFYGRGEGESISPPSPSSYFEKNLSNINIILCNC